MNIKWGFVDLYMLISKIRGTYTCRDRENDFTDFFINFERDRRNNIKDPKQLLNEDKDHWDKELYSYIEAFIHSGGTEKNIEKRHEVYIKRFLKEVQDLDPKDTRRTFSQDERIVIWRRDNESCQLCNKELSFQEMHADHIKPHSVGGKTTLDNAQALCQQCNATKGST